MLPWGVGNPRGTIRLDLPVTYQNLLDGVIEFIVNDGHGGSQTVVPIAYAPNNDLYVSADQGGFEITNVHPGSDLYTELVLTGNWSGSGKSLLSINVKPGPRLTGISGLVTWPEINSVSHQEPSGDVAIYFGNVNVDAKIESTDRFGNVETYISQNGAIVIPSADVENAISRRLCLELSINDEIYSQLYFLLETETEEFNESGLINQQGMLRPSTSGYISTDYIDIYDVNDIVYTGYTGGDAQSLVAYDENKDFVRVLLNTGAYNNTHVPVDGTFRYVRASAYPSLAYSLKLYFRTRG